MNSFKDWFVSSSSLIDLTESGENIENLSKSKVLGHTIVRKGNVRDLLVSSLPFSTAEFGKKLVTYKIFD